MQLFDLAVSFLVFDLQNMVMQVHKNLCAEIFIKAFCLTKNNSKQLKCPSNGGLGK